MDVQRVTSSIGNGGGSRVGSGNPQAPSSTTTPPLRLKIRSGVPVEIPNDAASGTQTSVCCPWMNRVHPTESLPPQYEKNVFKKMAFNWGSFDSSLTTDNSPVLKLLSQMHNKGLQAALFRTFFKGMDSISDVQAQITQIQSFINPAEGDGKISNGMHVSPSLVALFDTVSTGTTTSLSKDEVKRDVTSSLEQFKSLFQKLNTVLKFTNQIIEKRIVLSEDNWTDISDALYVQLQFNQVDPMIKIAKNSRNKEPRLSPDTKRVLAHVSGVTAAALTIVFIVLLAQLQQACEDDDGGDFGPSVNGSSTPAPEAGGSDDCGMMDVSPPLTGALIGALIADVSYLSWLCTCCCFKD